MNEREELESARIRNKSAFDKDAARWNALENESGFEYTKLLVTTASILLPLSFVALGVQIERESVIQLLTVTERSLIMISWTCLTVSLFVGSLNLWFDKMHYGRWLDVSLEASGIFSMPLPTKEEQAKIQSVDSYEKYDNLTHRSPKPRRSNFLLFLQTALLWSGVCILLYIFWKAISI